MKTILIVKLIGKEKFIIGIINRYKIYMLKNPNSFLFN